MAPRARPEAGADRLRRALLGVLPAAWCALAWPARGAARIDVRAHGARGDGRHDDTAAFQAAIDALPAAGGTVAVGAGDYLIDPLRSVRLRNRMHLRMDARARLLARPNAAPRAYVLDATGVEQVEISGGAIVGERDRHQGDAGEWGHGLMIRAAAQVTVRDLHISDCWGDGISIGGAKGAGGRIVPSRDIALLRVRCIGNRRQGLTIGRSRRVRVDDSEFADTGGALPGCGIDIEPDAGDIAHDVVIAGCRVRGNRGAGIQLYKRSSLIRVRDCTIEANQGHGVLVIGASDCEIAGNRIRRNGLGGLALRPGSADVAVSGNEFVGNAPKRGSPRSAQLSVAPEARDVRVAADNRYPD
ncbi:right-handed parallel beta-helix repeat-containing protein [Lysobacter silvisoli]|nr:right-handed parallel beta-helix repeat-containing protein [Lysobacter silvisoli]